VVMHSQDDVPLAQCLNTAEVSNPDSGVTSLASVRVRSELMSASEILAHVTDRISDYEHIADARRIQ